MIRLSQIKSNYQIVSVLPHTGGRAIAPIELTDLFLSPDIDLNQPVILFGPVPTWVYGRLVALCREAPWIGCFSAPEAEAVVIHSRVADVAVGDVVAIPLEREELAPAVLVVGPPDSGKSVLSNALRQSLVAQYPDRSIFLHRANWDGEGNWSHEGQDHALIQCLVRNHERRIHERPSATELLAAFFAYHEAAVMHGFPGDLVVGVAPQGGKPTVMLNPHSVPGKLGSSSVDSSWCCSYGLKPPNQGLTACGGWGWCSATGHSLFATWKRGLPMKLGHAPENWGLIRAWVVNLFRFAYRVKPPLPGHSAESPMT